MVAALVVPTALVLTMKVAAVAPAAIVTLAGVVATAVLSLDRLTTAPPVGAAPLNITVPVDDVPPVTPVGFKFRDETVTAGGLTVSAALAIPLWGAVWVTARFFPSALVLTVKVAVVSPAAIVTLAGIVATAELSL